MWICFLSISVASTPTVSERWVQSRPTPMGLLSQMQKTGLTQDEARQTERHIRHYMAKQAKSMHFESQNDACSEASIAIFQQPREWSQNLSGAQDAFFDSLFGIRTGYCLEKVVLEDVYETFMSKSFRLDVMPRLTHYDRKGDALCVQADGISGVVKKASFCLELNQRRFKDGIMIHTVLKSNEAGADIQPLYYREAFLLFVQRGDDVRIQRLIMTRAQTLNGFAKMFLKKTAGLSQPKIKAELVERTSDP